MPAKYVALLRGINVSGQKKIKMQELREALIVPELWDVSTYIQSGNILFNSVLKEQAQMEVLIHNIILQHFGFDVKVMVRSGAEIKEIMNGIPYNEEPKKIFITIFSDVPDPNRIEETDFEKFHPEKYIFKGKTGYFFAANGAAKSKMTNNFIESKLKVDATTRNLNTMNYLLAHLD